MRAQYDPSLMPDRRSVSWGRLAAMAPVILGSGVLLALGASILAFAPEPVVESNRKRLAERLREIVLEGLRPMVSGPSF